MICHKCQKEITITDKVGRRDECEHCSADLHVCLNCHFYDPSAYNECRETSADRVVDKDRANFCEYFMPRNPDANSGRTHGPRPPSGGSAPKNPADEARRKLEELFKKS